MAEPAQKKARTSRTFLFSSESVNEGHPDKICDQVSDAVPDACLTVDPKSKVACETATKDNMVMVAGEITTEAKLDYDKVVRGVVAQIGFDSFVDDLSSVDSKGLSHKSCEVLVRINKQSPDMMEFDCRPGAIAQSLALREPKYQETAAYCHFGREPVTKKLALRQDLSKYKSMNTTQVDAALKASTYLTKWVD
eukprot:Skav214529  [mRNA]  locus=scaffold410:257687:259867:- [translate_table: standard]